MRFLHLSLLHFPQPFHISNQVTQEHGFGTCALVPGWEALIQYKVLLTYMSECLSEKSKLQVEPGKV